MDEKTFSQWEKVFRICKSIEKEALPQFSCGNSVNTQCVIWLFPLQLGRKATRQKRTSHQILADYNEGGCNCVLSDGQLNKINGLRAAMGLFALPVSLELREKFWSLRAEGHAKGHH